LQCAEARRIPAEHGARGAETPPRSKIVRRSRPPSLGPAFEAFEGDAARRWAVPTFRAGPLEQMSPPGSRPAGRTIKRRLHVAATWFREAAGAGDGPPGPAAKNRGSGVGLPFDVKGT